MIDKKYFSVIRVLTLFIQLLILTTRKGEIMFFIFRTNKQMKELIFKELKKARQGNRDNTDLLILQSLQLSNTFKPGLNVLNETLKQRSKI